MNWYIVYYSLIFMVIIGLLAYILYDSVLYINARARTSFRHGLTRYVAQNVDEAFMLQNETFKQSQYNNFNAKLNNGCLACGSSPVAKMY